MSFSKAMCDKTRGAHEPTSYSTISGSSTASSSAGTCFFVPYAAPEILEKLPYNIAAETYSFGLVLWALASQREPFADRSLDDIRQSKLRGERLPMHVDWSVDDAFVELIARCTARDPRQRPSFEEIVQELTRASAEFGPVVFPKDQNELL